MSDERDRLLGKGALGEPPKVFVMGQKPQLPPYDTFGNPAGGTESGGSDSSPSESSSLDIDPDPYKDSPEQQKKKRLLIIGIVVLVLLLVIIGILLATHPKKPAAPAQTPTVTQPTDTETTTQAQPDTKKPCKKDWIEFASAETNTKFCYPSAWGTASVQDGRFDTSDRGTRRSIRFDKEPAVVVNVVSQDWATDTNREALCASLAAQTFPSAAENPSEKWQTAQGSATRDIESVPGKYLLREDADTLLTNEVCLQGYATINGEVYSIATATFGQRFGAGISTVEAHIKNPTALISAADRADFTAMTKTIQRN